MSASDLALSVKGLSKSYTIAHGGAKRPTFREAIIDRLRHPFKKADSETFWALKDITFNVNKGDVIGIIGRNGAGKSTLLKILSRITELTTGEIDVYGRIGSLLEVGTGFHPELTGRENIYLNGTILGMRRPEIRKHFDEIVDFAGIERFLDTPVKRYSSGMYVRLAFAVAAYLDSEILIIDEVLAVGDAQFQKKCLGKMKDLSQTGRTVLFVSHNTAAVSNLCKSALLLGGGRILNMGAVDEVLQSYLATAATDTNADLSIIKERFGTGLLRFVRISWEDCVDSGSGFSSGSGARITMTLHNTTNHALHSVEVEIGVEDSFGYTIVTLASKFTGENFADVAPGEIQVSVDIPRLPLAPGRYAFTVYCAVDGQAADWIQRAVVVDVAAGDYYGTGRLPGPTHGKILVEHSFNRVNQRGGQK